MKLLLIEDNKELRETMTRFLKNEGYSVLESESGEEGLATFQVTPVDLVLLDIMLPGIDGFQVCQRIREQSMVPLIMITAKSEDHDKILGLDVGADDYLVKPFSNKELAARIRAITRRLAIEKEYEYHVEGLSLDSRRYEVKLKEEPVHLTKKEFDLLHHFMEHPNQIFTRDHLLDVVWGIDYYGDFRTVDSHIKRLREKLKTEEIVNWQIKTVWGKGYLFEVNNK